MSYRKIKFRGKNNQSQWVYGALIPPEFSSWYEPSIFDGNMRMEVDGETLGQYTGCRDCYGMEIYEGDVLEISATDKREQSMLILRAVVRFGEHFAQSWSKVPGESCLGYYMEFANGFPKKYYRAEFLYWHKNSKIKIIGNIYDNPELLEDLKE